MKEPTFSIHERGEKAHNGIALSPVTLEIYFSGIYGTYNFRNQNIKISSTKEEMEEIVKVIDHEYFHYILHDVVGIEATQALDNIDNRQNHLI